MRIYSGENLEIKFDAALCECVEKSIANFDRGIDYVQALFDCDLKKLGKVKASFFTKREEFLEHIKSLDDNADVPEWATACFYGGESQILINPDDEADMNRRKYTLLHEAIHLIIQKSVYDKYRIDRIVWFDEAFACFLDCHIENILQKELEETAKKLKHLAENFDMNKLNDFSLIKTQEYDGYDMFLLIGKYIFDNNLQKEYVEILKSNPIEMKAIGRNILMKAVKHSKHI